MNVTRTEVDFDQLTEDAIHGYVLTGLPMDKAGG
jgi:predicted house-cleaning NTP pyrophosphatase (Maf/HAM1 superfamily)